jgi:uncharacterized HhH-GPD family protein
MARPDALPFTPDPEANALLAAEPLAVLIGMLLDQQITMEMAFRGPSVLRDRLDGSLDAAAIAGMPEADLVAVFSQRPALHRFPGSMAKRTQALCAHLVEHYDGRADALWRGVRDAEELRARLMALPGFGPDKARIFVGVLGKRLRVRPKGWEAVAADWASIADVDRYERIAEIRDAKRAAKAAKTAKAGKPAAPVKAAAKTPTARKPAAPTKAAKPARSG